MGPRGYKKEPEAKVGSSFEITDSIESIDIFHLKLQAMKSKQSTPIDTDTTTQDPMVSELHDALLAPVTTP